MRESSSLAVTSFKNPAPIYIVLTLAANRNLRPRPHVSGDFLYPQIFLCGYT